MRCFAIMGTAIGFTLLVVGTRSVGADEMAKAYVHYYRPLIGSWKMVIEEGGTVEQGTSNWRLSANSTSLLIDSRIDGQQATQSVQGFDVKSGIWTMARFDGDGHFTLGTLDHTAFQPGATMGVGQVGIWKDTIVKNGRPVARTATVGCEKMADNQIVLAWTNIKEDGDDAPAIRIALERLPGAPTASASSVDASAAGKKPGEDKEQMKATSPLLKEYGELLVGEWECKASVPWGAAAGSEKVAARVTCCWAVGNAALNSSAQIGDVAAQGLTWWDNVSQRVRTVGVGENGASFTMDIVKKGDRWISTITMTSPDGERFETSMVTTFSDDGNTHFNEYATHTDVFTRVKK